MAGNLSVADNGTYCWPLCFIFPHLKLFKQKIACKAAACSLLQAQEGMEKETSWYWVKTDNWQATVKVTFPACSLCACFKSLTLGFSQYLLISGYKQCQGRISNCVAEEKWDEELTVYQQEKWYHSQFLWDLLRFEGGQEKEDEILGIGEHFPQALSRC